MSGKRIFGVLMIALLGSVLGVVVFSLFVKPEVKIVQTEAATPVQFTGLPSGGFDNADFRMAAEQSVHAVVHVTSEKFLEQNQYKNMWEYFFDEPSSTRKIPKKGYGSGVFISSEGHIVTNNHVVEGFEAFKVKLNDGRVLDAELVGADPNTDVAVLRVKEKDYSYMTFGNSDDLHLGDWVLAVGNPFNLYSTVTAGIVSAKGRDMNIIGRPTNPYEKVDIEKMANAVESFIQTDAAVNPGNSGGALVNLKGELVGINTAIASRTGSFSGYSFAIPAAIAKKVVNDIIEFGSVQRGVLGVEINTVNAEFAEKERLNVNKGVYVADLTNDGGAHKAGIEIGDVITAVNGNDIIATPGLQEQISRFHPDDIVEVEVDRNGKRKVFDVTLSAVDPDAIKVGDSAFMAKVGAELEKLSGKELERYNIRSGVRVKKLRDGEFKDAGMPEGFIITKINKSRVRDVEDIERYLEQIDEAEEGARGVFIEGRLRNGRYEFFTYKK